jgi:Protoglobin
MDSMHQIARAAIDQTPPVCRVTAEHAAVIAANADALAAMGPEIATGFYDTLYAHDATAKIFNEGERPMREQTLTGWWERTVRGPIDDDYWAWMAMVGLTHVVRRVTNPMMLAMADYVADFVATNSYRLQLAEADRVRLVEGFGRVASMTRSIITYGYDHAMAAALYERAGIPEALLARLGDQSIRDALVDAKSELGL